MTTLYFTAWYNISYSLLIVLSFTVIFFGIRYSVVCAHNVAIVNNILLLDLKLYIFLLLMIDIVMNSLLLCL